MTTVCLTCWIGANIFHGIRICIPHRNPYRHIDTHIKRSQHVSEAIEKPVLVALELPQIRHPRDSAYNIIVMLLAPMSRHNQRLKRTPLQTDLIINRHHHRILHPKTRHIPSKRNNAAWADRRARCSF